MSDVPARLPMWPLFVLFGLIPVWWALGALYFVWSLYGVLLAAILFARGRVRLPAGTALWLVFIGIAAVSLTRIDRFTGYLTSGLRLGFLLTAFTIGVYVYNLARDGAPWRRLLLPLCLLWLSMVVLGWLGVVAPTWNVVSPMEAALPHAIASERFIHDLTHLKATENNPLGRFPIYRPASPFPYTNNWGTAYSMLVPCVIAYLSSVRNGPMRVVLLVSLPLSVVPAFLTLNRGMFIGLGIGLAYLAVRAVARGHVGLVLAIGGLVLVAWVANFFIPVADLISDRTTKTDTTSDRLDLYAQTWNAVVRSPFLGYGAPATVDTTHAAEPLGTQGFVWQVLYSHGIPALVVFYLLLYVLARRLALATSAAGQWLSAIPVIAVAVSPFYSFIDPNMSVIAYAAALGIAAVDGPVNRPVVLQKASA